MYQFQAVVSKIDVPRILHEQPKTVRVAIVTLPGEVVAFVRGSAYNAMYRAQLRTPEGSFPIKTYVPACAPERYSVAENGKLQTENWEDRRAKTPDNDSWLAVTGTDVEAVKTAINELDKMCAVRHTITVEQL
jgi:hypothetical protein